MTGNAGAARALLATALAAAIAACAPPPDALEQVRVSGELRVATMNGPTTYYFDAYGPAGFEYELVRGFADELGVDLELVVPPSFERLLPLVAKERVHFAAAGITVTAARLARVRFGPSYQMVTQQVVYRRGTHRPRDLEDLVGRELHVIAGSSYEERLRELAAEHPGLGWTARDDLGAEELAERVSAGAIAHTVLDSNLVSQLQRLYPELAVAFDLSSPQPLAWAFPLADDDSLLMAASRYLARLERSGELARLRDRYYGPAFELDYVDARTFLRHIEERLPPLEPLLRAAAKRYALDWRLIAAVAYQESRWDPEARSPTGVRGLMMLTRRTARRVGVDNRLDPRESVLGGARYLRELHERLPERIAEPDRTWLALAAYNVGLGHLEDARVLTERAGADPDSWQDVREFLPLLARREWFAQTRYGYARGHEPVRFVRNVRRYYDVLRRRDAVEPPPAIEAPPLLRSPLL